MALVAIIFDHALDPLRGSSGCPSVLGLPLGTGRVLNAFVDRAARADADRILVIPTFDFDETYRKRLAASGRHRIELWPLDRQQELVQACEGEDIIITFDGRYWLEGVSEAMVLHEACAHGRTAVYAASPVGGDENAGERVLTDELGRVKKIRRLYEKVGAPLGRATGVACGVLPQQFAEAGPLYPLADSRLRFLTQGMPCKDQMVPSGMLDLLEPSDVLELNRRRIASDVRAAESPPGFRRTGTESLVARNACLSDTVRLMGPVIVQDGAVIDAGTTIVGPSVIGRGAIIGHDSLVVRCVLPDGCTVPAETKLIRSVGLALPGNERAGRAAARAQEPMSVAADEGLQLPALQAPRGYLAFKRALDIVGALAGLLLLLPFAPFLILLLKLDSRGPAFFRHRREGRGGREFPCIKFRTMQMDAHELQKELAEQNEVDGPQFKISNDPRITRIGRWLRRLNIDELPQLVNVLLGQMSLVGPRPSPFRENQICVPWRQARLSVRPGLTGLWQICRSTTRDNDFSEWIHYDVKYVRHMSLRLDLKILFYTIVSLGGRHPVGPGRLIPMGK